jgi:hypothetical protein
MSTAAGVRDATAEISPHSWTFGRSVDRLITVEMRPPGLPYGKIDRLLDAALAESGHKSQLMAAADLLVRSVQPGDPVFIVTGAGTPPFLPEGENDGPVGAATLARSVLLGLGAVPIYLLEEHHLRPVVTASAAAGVPIRPSEVAVQGARGAFAETAPLDEADVSGWAREMFERYSPAAVIFIERLGPNRNGIIHGSTGKSGWKPQVDLSPLLTEATERGIPSIGIGDAGNEIGFGRIFDDVCAIQEFGGDCHEHCACGGGMATTAITDVLVVAAVSNWGGYGIDACLAHLLGDSGLAQTPEIGRRVADACLEGGGFEAVFCTQSDSVDGIANDSSVSLVQILKEMVRISLLPADAGPAH